MVGTPPRNVTRWRSMSCSTPGALNRGTSTSAPPTDSTALCMTVIPKAWNRGRATRATVLSSRSTRPAAARALDTRLAWVSSAPLGLPVVPDV